MKCVGKMRKAELSLETMSPVGRNDSMCTNVFSLCLNDSRYAAVLIGLHGLWGSEGARANVIMHAPKPQTMHGLRDPGSRSATTPGVSATASFASGFLYLFFFILLCNCEQKAAVKAQELWCNCSTEKSNSIEKLHLHTIHCSRLFLLLVCINARRARGSELPDDKGSGSFYSMFCMNWIWMWKKKNLMFCW